MEVRSRIDERETVCDNPGTCDCSPEYEPGNGTRGEPGANIGETIVKGIEKSFQRVDLAGIFGSWIELLGVLPRHISSKWHLLSENHFRRNERCLEWAIYALEKRLVPANFLGKHICRCLSAMQGKPSSIADFRVIEVGDFLEEKGLGKEQIPHIWGEFGKQLKELYVERYGEEPQRTGESNGSVFFYTTRDLDLFEETFQRLDLADVPVNSTSSTPAAAASSPTPASPVSPMSTVSPVSQVSPVSTVSPATPVTHVNQVSQVNLADQPVEVAE